MNEELKAPVVTPDDVLAGEITFPVGTRTGTSVKVTVRALDWRTALGANSDSARGDVESMTVRIIRNCLPKEQQKDAFLDAIVPAHLFWITTAAMQLSNGVDEAKKNAALKNGPPSEISSAPKAT